MNLELAPPCLHAPYLLRQVETERKANFRAACHRQREEEAKAISTTLLTDVQKQEDEQEQEETQLCYRCAGGCSSHLHS